MTSSQLVPTSSLSSGTHLSTTSSRTVPPYGDGTRSGWTPDTPPERQLVPTKRDEDEPNENFWPAAACRELPADWFHPERGESTREAKAVCATCAVRIDCLRWAINTYQRFGVWGGASERERRRIRQRLTGGEPVPELDPAAPPPAEPEEEEPVDLRVVSPQPASPNGNHPVDDEGRLTDACVNCGRRYTPDRKTQRFCRKECARAWYSSHPRGTDTGARQPRIRSAPAAKKPKASGATKQPGATAAPPPAAIPSPTEAGPIDLEKLIAQVLATCDRWAIEADLGDVRVSITRGCPR